MGIQIKFDGRYLTSPSGTTLPKMGGNLDFFFEIMSQFGKNLPKKKPTPHSICKGL
jgi:hypothetical protein